MAFVIDVVFFVFDGLRSGLEVQKEILCWPKLQRLLCHLLKDIGCSRLCKLKLRLRACFACLHDLVCFSNRMSGATEQMIRQEHLWIVVCGHDDSGQGSTTGRLPFELDSTSKREPDGPTPEAERLEKLFLAAALNMDDLKGETE